MATVCTIPATISKKSEFASVLCRLTAFLGEEYCALFERAFEILRVMPDDYENGVTYGDCEAYRTLAIEVNKGNWQAIYDFVHAR